MKSTGQPHNEDWIGPNDQDGIIFPICFEQ